MHHSRHMVLLGRVGHGKSTFGSKVLGWNPSNPNETPEFLPGLEATGVTTSCTTKTAPWGRDYSSGLMLSITDTPGWGDSSKKMTEKDLSVILANSFIAMATGHENGVSVICIVLSGVETRVPKETLTMMRLYESLLGREMWKHAIIVITNCDPSQKNEPRYQLCETEFPAAFKREFGLQDILGVSDIPVFRSSDDFSIGQYRSLKNYLIHKESVYQTKLLQEIKQAWIAGSFSKVFEVVTFRLKPFTKWVTELLASD